MIGVTRFEKTDGSKDFLVGGVNRNGQEVYSILSFDYEDLVFPEAEEGSKWNSRSIIYSFMRGGAVVTLERESEETSGYFLRISSDKKEVEFKDATTITHAQYYELSQNSGWLVLFDELKNKSVVLFVDEKKEVNQIATIESSGRFVGGVVERSFRAVVAQGAESSPKFSFLAFKRNQLISRIEIEGLPNGIENWLGKIDGDKIHIVVIEGDSLFGEAKLKAFRYEVRGQGIRQAWASEMALEGAHLGLPLLVQNQSEFAFGVKAWLDSESTIWLFTIANGKLSRKPYGVFSQLAVPLEFDVVDSKFVVFMKEKKGLKEFVLACKGEIE